MSQKFRLGLGRHKIITTKAKKHTTLLFADYDSAGIGKQSHIPASVVIPAPENHF
jgi:hypothetical protein